ncbi:hypothetical protein [Salipiger mucosus]|uniref:Uncharacterized protein n=1 Tax=Salipiger mucosus DSM 16094 TaxID=1123237 RepID=S9QQW9_9RHOB|nr:hypothetical protein [Salipiger mucosus]EPX82028.1 hypothetical protein Salmuc_02393 [Salipiger mucosus DSM 16094]
MSRNTKIATCTYCGTRAALVLDQGRHELTCASCGAPLHDLKQLRSDAVDRDSPRRKPAPRQTPRDDPPASPWDKKLRKVHKKARKKLAKKRKGKSAAKGLFDLIEDIFD